LENLIFSRNTGAVKRSEQIIVKKGFINLQRGPAGVLDYRSVARAASRVAG
jgi:hypothetical protein